MDAGGRAASGTKAEESSGFNKPFPPQAGMTTQGYDFDRLVADRHKSGSIWSFGPVSWIPAFACLRQAGRNDGGGGNANKGMPTDRAIRQNPAPINRPGSVSWIPAFAGMTEGARMTTKIACVCLSLPSSLQGMTLDRFVADRHKPGSVWRFGRRFLDSGLRRNDGGLRSGIFQEWQRNYGDGNPLFLCSSSFRRRPESSGLDKPFPPQAGMTTQGYDFDRFVADRHKPGSV